MDWRIKAVTQAALAVMPGGTAINDLLQWTIGTRKPGLCDKKISSKLAEVRSMLQALREFGFDLAGARVLEIGTGWEPVIPVYLSGLGAKVTSVDLRRHLRTTQAVRNKLASVLKTMQHELAFSDRQRTALSSFTTGDTTIEELLERLEIDYLAPLLDSKLMSLRPSSFDLIYSIAVMEHVKPEDLETMLAAHDHLLTPTGIAYHDIGLGDHFTGIDSSITSANFLQYDGMLWRWLGENHLAYHNRLRKSDFERVFHRRGYAVRWAEHKLDERAAELIRSGRLRPVARYSGYSVEDLATWRLRVILSAASRP